MKNEKNEKKHDAVKKLVRFQRTGKGFDGVWAEIGPIVDDFARLALRKTGVTSAAGDFDHAVGDVVNETVLKLMSLAEPGAGGRFNPAKATQPGLSGLRGWLWRVVERQAANWGRTYRGRRGPRIVCESCLDLNDLVDDGATSFLDRQVAKVERPDLLPILEACIARLDDPFQRDIVRLKLHEELSLRDTAERLGVSVTRVQRQMCRALALLRGMLDDGGLDGTWLAA